MSFTCQNSTCAIALSKAAFPVAMNCPVCQQPLVELKEPSSVSYEDEIKQTLLEKHVWTYRTLRENLKKGYGNWVCI
jgi:hypothetical protein